MNLLSLGIENHFSPYMKEKIKLNNKVTLISAFIEFSYIIVIAIHYPALLVFPVVAFFNSCISLALTYFKFVQLSRFINSFQMLLMASMYHAGMVSVEDPIIMPLYLSLVSMVVIPWLIYSLHEKTLLFASVCACFAVFFIQPFLNQIFEYGSDMAFFREGYLNYMTYGFAMGITVFFMYMIRADKSDHLIDG